MRIVLATSNPGKLAELQALLAPMQVELSPLSMFSAEAAEEVGLSFVENAILKARHAAAVSGLPAIADDSGIEVDVLQGAPGIRSARYAGERASDAQNLSKLLSDLADVPAGQRSARYRCALVYMRWQLDPAPIICQASWEGSILQHPRGSGGFGYDPIFLIAGRDVTAAEITAAEKNRISHRGRALAALASALEAERRKAI